MTCWQSYQLILIFIQLFLYLLHFSSCDDNIRRFRVGNYEIEISRAIEVGSFDIDIPADGHGGGYVPDRYNLGLKKSLCGGHIQNEDLEQNYRIDQRTNKCYSILFGEKGPCGQNMLFYGQQNNTLYGKCDCEQEARTLLYDEGTNQCHPIFTKAFCQQGDWLTLSRQSLQPICERNPCASAHAQDDDVVFYNNHCAKLGGGSPSCNGSIEFMHGKILPRCFEFAAEYEADIEPGEFTTPAPAAGAGGSGDYHHHESSPMGGGGGGLFKPTNQLPPCPLASLRSLSGNCQGSWEW